METLRIEKSHAYSATPWHRCKILQKCWYKLASQ